MWSRDNCIAWEISIEDFRYAKGGGALVILPPTETGCLAKIPLIAMRSERDGGSGVPRGGAAKKHTEICFLPR